MITISPRVAWVDRGESVWLLNLSAEEPTPVELTDSAAALWRLLPAASVGELAERVGVDFSVPVDAVIADVENYVASMLDQGFVEVA